MPRAGLIISLACHLTVNFVTYEDDISWKACTAARGEAGGEDIYVNCWMTLILSAEYGGVCSIDSVQNFLVMSLKIAEIYGFINFYNGGRHPSLIF